MVLNPIFFKFVGLVGYPILNLEILNNLLHHFLLRSGSFTKKSKFSIRTPFGPNELCVRLFDSAGITESRGAEARSKTPGGPLTIAV